MTLSLALKVALVWFGISILAVVNGTLRQFVLVPHLGMGIALPLSGLILAFLILLVTYLTSGFLGVHTTSTYLLIGTQWVVMTLAFEFLFGHYVVGKSWPELLQGFNILKGDLFSLVVLVTFWAPYLVGKIRN